MVKHKIWVSLHQSTISHKETQLCRPAAEALFRAVVCLLRFSFLSIPCGPASRSKHALRLSLPFGASVSSTASARVAKFLSSKIGYKKYRYLTKLGCYVQRLMVSNNFTGRLDIDTILFLWSDITFIYLISRLQSPCFRKSQSHWWYYAHCSLSILATQAPKATQRRTFTTYVKTFMQYMHNFLLQYYSDNFSLRPYLTKSPSLLHRLMSKPSTKLGNIRIRTQSQ